MKAKDSKTNIKTLSNLNVSRISKANSTNRLNTEDLKSDKFYVFKGTGNSRFMLTKINEEDEFNKSKKFSPKRYPHRYSLLDYKNNHHMTDINSLGLGNHNSGTEKWHENYERNLRKIQAAKKIDKLNSSLIKKSISLENYNIYKSKRIANSSSSLGKAKKFSVILDYRNKNK